MNVSTYLEGLAARRSALDIIGVLETAAREDQRVSELLGTFLLLAEGLIMYSGRGLDALKKAHECSIQCTESHLALLLCNTFSLLLICLLFVCVCVNVFVF